MEPTSIVIVRDARANVASTPVAPLSPIRTNLYSDPQSNQTFSATFVSKTM